MNTEGKPRRRKSQVTFDAMEDKCFGYSPAEVKLSRVVRAVYVRARSMLESRLRAVTFEYRPPRSYDLGSGSVERKPQPPVWLKLSRWLLEQRLEPFNYISFCVSASLARPPEPADLLRPATLERFQAYRRMQKDSIRQALKHEHVAFRDAVADARRDGASTYDTWGDVLTDETVSLSPLFRYCLAYSIGGVGFTRIASYYHTAALTQFAQYPAAYARYWHKLLPDGFAKTARREYLRRVCNV